MKMLGKLYALIWKEECVPMKWREGLIVSLFKKGDKEDPGNYRGITLLSVVGKLFCKILNDPLNLPLGIYCNTCKPHISNIMCMVS